MCLSTLDPKPLRKRGIGYKIVHKINKKYYCYDHPDDTGKVEYILNKWITDPKEGLSDSGQYRTGFHIMLDLSTKLGFLPSKTFPIIKVQFRDVVATQIKSRHYLYGRQVVARQIKMLGEVPYQDVYTKKN